VILAEDDGVKWLDEEPATSDELKALLVPYKDDALTMWRAEGRQCPQQGL
jgi:putative SOS response-associated peptidase YedK